MNHVRMTAVPDTGWMGPERYALLAGCDFTLLPSRPATWTGNRLLDCGRADSWQVGAVRTCADGGQDSRPVVFSLPVLSP